MQLMGEMGISFDMNTEIPVEHQQEVLERIKNSNPENNVPLDIFFENLNEKLKEKSTATLL
ncbi:MAG: hypothetical protein Q8S14_00525 [Algoriphagus sp.]|uniref:hypothetical protein n=1 Tax=Algoriphagus sp. TaxID=1872435 RepID=UPI00272FC2F5|nr:hypothetical protein [Algoriphagus sp.]MDP3470325.1 hypothetical protein [Algoriphagus sp.]